MTKEYFNISEMAKLRKVTIETLRHYDRIDLLKPDYIDHNRIRYYHITKAEKIRTIRELQEIGLSLKEIKIYLENRTLEHSYKLLLQKQEYIKKQYEFYKSLYRGIQEKIQVLDQLSIYKKLEEIYEKEFPERYCFLSESRVHNEEELFYQTTKLEGIVEELEGYLQIYGSQRYGAIFKVDEHNGVNRPFLFISPNPQATIIPAGRYLCLMKSNSFWDIEKQKIQLQEYAKQKGYHMSDHLLSIVQVDYTMSDFEEERLYELQWRIENITTPKSKN